MISGYHSGGYEVFYLSQQKIVLYGFVSEKHHPAIKR
jgi:hypothetical protein